MEHWIGKKVNIVFKSDGQISYYTAIVEQIKDGFITFVDKYGDRISKNLSDLNKISEVIR